MGQKEHALPAVRRAQVGCAEQVPREIVPERGQVTRNLSEGVAPVSGKEPRDVLHEDEAGSKLSNDPSILAPEARALTREARLLPGEGEVLAREAADDPVDAGEVVAPWDGAAGADVPMSNSVGPVPAEDGGAERVNLDLPDNAASSGVLDAQVQPTDPREQRAQQEVPAVLAAQRHHHSSAPAERSTGASRPHVKSTGMGGVARRLTPCR